MILLNKIPGTILVILGALCLSFGGIIVKSFEGANLWQILFWRQTFFSIIVALYLLITFKKNFFKSFHASGLPGIIAGIFLGIGFSAYVFAMSAASPSPIMEAAFGRPPTVVESTMGDGEAANISKT